jgi:hypothetical protein
LTAGAIATGWLARLERFDVVGSTNDVVMDCQPSNACVPASSAATFGRNAS